MSPTQLLSLLQLASPALPVGAYSYSEGLEILVERGAIATTNDLQSWIENSLNSGAIRIEAAILTRIWQAQNQQNFPQLQYWNHWTSAAKETEELRQQSWQMGRALHRLLSEIQPSLLPSLTAIGTPSNYVVVFGIAAANWQIPLSETLLGYLQSWATNLIAAGIKLIPLGQTAGQKLILDLQPSFIQASQEILSLTDDDLSSCNWGLTLASMAHETQYTRLFRS